MRRYEDDDDRIVADGEAVHVPLMMMDSTQRAVATDALRRKVVQRDPMGRVASTYEEEPEEEQEDAASSDAALALHRPGYRTSIAVDDDEAVAAYNQYVRDQANAWRTTDQPAPAKQPADAHPSGPVYDAAEGQRIKDAAWQEMCERQRNAWKAKP
jgi:hypothetical protein